MAAGYGIQPENSNGALWHLAKHLNLRSVTKADL